MTKKKKTCPLCHKTDQVIPIIYGFPSDELFQKAEKGELKLGGCMMEPSNPDWYCKSDNKVF